LPLFFTRKEAFEWLKLGEKTIEVRKGNPRRGEVAVFQSGPSILRLNILKKETGRLAEVVRSDNYKLVVPSALCLGDAFAYLRGLYVGYDGVFTAYYIVS
jgi:ASC-1-like (ASCH) protein